MPETQLNLRIDGAIARAKFVTDGGLNVLSSTTLDRVQAVADEVRRSRSVRVLVLAATGKVFVAGANIKELAGLDSAGAAAIARKGIQAFDALADLSCVTIARLHGAALGGGFELTLACDFRFALKDAKIGLPESSLGLIPGWHGIKRVHALAGPQTARKLAFSAAPISAHAGLGLGLIDEVADDEAALDAMIADRVEALRRASPHAIAQIKRVLRGSDDVQAFADCFTHPDGPEGMAAFVEKRPARWLPDQP